MEAEMTGREQLHDLRQRAHNAGIEGNSKMTESQLKDALKRAEKGMSPQAAKQQAKR
ncbi:hypothetical protein [Micromonospora sp. URMC 103]|uniref:hypothetical protein n=1 Tax=Micromonospora sp. URMC 103 TaxID=3423406 RepID=UPI003F1C2812